MHTISLSPWLLCFYDFYASNYFLISSCSLALPITRWSEGTPYSSPQPPPSSSWAKRVETGFAYISGS